MEQAVIEKEYVKLVRERRKIDRAMRAIITRMRTRKMNEGLLDIGRLNIRGGPKDLSKNMDSYLYQ
ncbi:hypothetical protein A3A21_04135 [Candidatus Jorgensenbacteria bacterium RIFCSPLOWO2_01_FULL_45_25b]|uniref:Uncharacterized protein n=1 Tax=Candidatus Jorgensenbacteria bacterium RIFCSPLOWO2_01_FULL_45_25b TaxID=1798471 RepID=A0A1F6BWL6_9BACT|nr:MAG: hypothetical protein A3A21_04135 [Candidatus Jorgensenbacteria bacterium RIFCSPLOWO2_01_FULL_45_25b]